MTTEIRSAGVGELGGPVASGLELRDALGGTYKDIDEASGQVLVEFPHETVDSFKTVFGKRAFAESFEQRLPTMCWQHDIRNPIGHAITAQVTPKVNEVRGQFSNFDDVPDARRAFSQINDGTITDFSFGFKGAKFERADGLGKGVRRITHAFMAEFSPVTIGSIPGAVATGLREDSSTIMEIGQIIYLRDQGLVTPDGFRDLLEEHHPELIGKIQVRDISGDDEDADDNSGAAAEDLVNGPRWDASDAGTHTATGPMDEILRVKPVTDQDGDITGHIWVVMDSEGNKIADGEADGDDAAEAKDAAWAACQARSEANWEIPSFVTADDIRSALEESHPGIALVLSESIISIGDPSDSGTRAADGPAAGLIASTRDALDSALMWLDDVDTDLLPDAVQQSLALTRAAAMSAEAVMQALGIESRDDDGDDDGDDDSSDESDTDDDFHHGDWDGSSDNFTPEQWKSSTLIDTGKGDPDSKDRYKLPIKTPEGKVSVKGVAAASGRLGQVDATAEQKTEAAKKLMSLHGKMGKSVPPEVLKHAGNKRDAAIGILDRLLDEAPVG